MPNSVKKIILLVLTVVSLFAVVFGFFQEASWSSQDHVMHNLRIQAIQQLIQKKFNRFVTIPFGPGNDIMHLTWSITYPDYPDYTVTTGINLQDDLDLLLEKKLQGMNGLYHILSNVSPDSFTLSDEEINQLYKVYLFKTQQDLEDLWYVVSSYRTRINNDADRRKNNISISYRNIGNIRVLNPDEEFSFMNEVHNDHAVKYWTRDFVAGRAIMWGITKVPW